MLDITAILTEPEPISVYVPTIVTEPVTGRKRETLVLTALSGLYEIHDSVSSLVMEGDVTRREVTPHLFGSVDSDMQAGRTIKVTGTGPHAGKEYSLGIITDWTTHIECDLDDV